MQTRGVVYIHSSPPAVCPHVEWAISSALSMPVRLDWVDQPAAPGSLRAECVWSGPTDTATALANALKSWPMLRFEVTEEPTTGTDGERISHVPGRGIFRTQVGVNGDLMISENQLRALRHSARTAEDFQHGVDKLLGAAWDDELEDFRHGGDGAPVTWLHKVG